jgi:hypothetical protein
MGLFQQRYGDAGVDGEAAARRRPAQQLGSFGEQKWGMPVSGIKDTASFQRLSIAASSKCSKTPLGVITAATRQHLGVGHGPTRDYRRRAVGPLPPSCGVHIVHGECHGLVVVESERPATRPISVRPFGWYFPV